MIPSILISGNILCVSERLDYSLFLWASFWLTFIWLEISMLLTIVSLIFTCLIEIKVAPLGTVCVCGCVSLKLKYE